MRVTVIADWLAHTAEKFVFVHLSFSVFELWTVFVHIYWDRKVCNNASYVCSRLISAHSWEINNSIYFWIHISASVQLFLYLYTSVFLYLCTSVFLYLCTSLYLYLYTYLFLYLYTSLFLYLCTSLWPEKSVTMQVTVIFVLFDQWSVQSSIC